MTRAKVPTPTRRPTILGLREDAARLLAELRDAPVPAIGGDTVGLLRRAVEHVDRCVGRAEKDSAGDHADGDPREADVARRLGVSPATLRRYRGAVRAERADR